jgi:hypothetical protein
VPVSDRVLGSHLDLEGVEQAAHAEIKRRFFAAITNDAELSASDRVERIADLVRVTGVRLALACEGEQLQRYLVIGHDGTLRIVGLADSRAPDRVEPPAGDVGPEILLELSGDHGNLELPFRWQSRDELLRSIVEIAPQLAMPAVFVAEIAGQRFEITTEHGRLRCQPLHLVAPDDGPGFGEAFCDVAGIPLPSPADRVELVLRQRPSAPAAPPMRDQGRPYTTGTAEQRRASIAAATAAKAKDWARFIAALQDPANADPRYDQVRRDLYRYLAAHDKREIAGLFLWALQEESESMIETITLLAWRQSALLAALPDLVEAAEARGDQRTAARMRAALDEAHP